MSKPDISLRMMVYTALFAALTAVGAYIIVPLPLIPITGQTVFVLLAGALLGKAAGAFSQVVYLLMGLLGFPVFSGGRAGFGVILGPTGGYLWGFILAAFIVGMIVERNKSASNWVLIVAFLFGEAMIFTCGILQLALVAKMSFTKAITVGFLPFLPGEMLKVVLALGATKVIRKRIKVMPSGK